MSEGQPAAERPGSDWTIETTTPGAILSEGLRLRLTAYPPDDDEAARTESPPHELTGEGRVLSVRDHPNKPGVKIIQVEIGDHWS